MNHDDQWLVMSRLVGLLPVGDQLIATHILARTRLVLDKNLAEILDWFAVPRNPRQLFGPDESAHEVLEHTLRQLQSGGILRVAGNDEAGRILEFYRTELRLPKSDAGWQTPTTTSANSKNASGNLPWLSSDDAADPELWTRIPCKDTSLVLSQALAVLELDNQEVLVTHPLSAPIHLHNSVWRLAKLFVFPTRLAALTQAFLEAGISIDEALSLCACLQRWKILWLSHDDEKHAAQQYIDQFTRVSSHSVFPTENRWRQKFHPYQISDLTQRQSAGAVALIGPCHLQLAAEALQVLAQRDGICLRIEGMLESSDQRLQRTAWTLVVMSATQFAANLYEAIACEDLAKVKRLSLTLLARVDDAVDKLRQQTAAPLLVTSISSPGLNPLSAESNLWHSINAVLAKLNADIAIRLENHQDAWLLDENRLVMDHSPGVYWDDEFNALPHHSPTSSWSWFSFKEKLNLPNFQAEQGYAPVPSPEQIDPAYVLGLGILQILKRLYVVSPIQLIVFDPNNLLWSGCIEERTHAYETPPHFYADVEEYLFAGLHEALSVLKRRGTKLACVTNCSEETLIARWDTPSTLNNLIRLEDLSAIANGDDWSTRIAMLQNRTGVNEQDMLVLAFPTPQIPGFKGRIFTDGRYSLRRYLLTDPALNVLPTAANPATSNSSMSNDSGLSMNTTVVSGSEPSLYNVVMQLIAASTKLSVATVKTCPDLRLIGLESVTAVELVSKLESRFSITFEDHQMVEPILFSPAALVQAVRDSLNSAVHETPTYIPRQDCYGGLDYNAWCDRDLSSVIAANIKSPAVPWVIKFVGADGSNDAEYLSWKQLHERASHFIAHWQNEGLVAGNHIAIAIPHGVDQVCALVGSILGRFVPCILPTFPMPSESLSSLMAQLKPQAVICDRHSHASIKYALQSAGYTGAVFCPASRVVSVPHYPEKSRPDAPVLIQHSSGTTGTRKAIMLNDRQVLSQVWQIAHAVDCTTTDRVVTWLPMYHDMGFICTLMLPLMLSVPCVMIKPGDWVKRPHLLLQEVSNENATLTWMPNFALAHTARTVDDRYLRGLDLTSLRVLVNGGEPATKPAIEAFLHKLSPYGLLPTAITGGYGAAEATAGITQSKPGRTPRQVRAIADVLEIEQRIEPASVGTPDEQVRLLISTGSVLCHTQVRIVDGRGVELPDGHIGELVVSGDSVVNRYEDNESATARSFQGGEFRTGDLGFFLEGDVFVTGRKDDLIIVSGRKLFPNEIEEVAGDTPGVMLGRTVALGIADAETGTQQFVLMVETEQTELSQSQREQLERLVSTRILDRWGIAPRVELVERNTLIATSSGKLSRSANRRFYIKTHRQSAQSAQSLPEA